MNLQSVKELHNFLMLEVITTGGTGNKEESNSPVFKIVYIKKKFRFFILWAN